jgi:hypothetical protein
MDTTDLLIRELHGSSLVALLHVNFLLNTWCLPVAGVRARLAGLPDAERRAAATELALQLAAMMGLDGDDDENDSTCDGYADS